MKANELRIGNLVINHLNEVQEITASCIVAQSQFDIANAEGYKYIVLTQEILEKCNFFKNGNKFINENCSLNIIQGNGFYMSYVVKDIKYLHQLQNLYFALTSEELNISELL